MTEEGLEKRAEAVNLLLGVVAVYSVAIFVGGIKMLKDIYDFRKQLKRDKKRVERLLEESIKSLDTLVKKEEV